MSTIVRGNWARASGAVAVYLASIIVFLAAWNFASISFIIPSLFPSPARTVVKTWELLTTGVLVWDVGATMARIAAGFLLGSAIGFLLGVSMGASRIIQFAADPYVNFLRFIGGTAWIQVATLWLGLGESAKIAVVTYVTVFVVALNTLAGYRAIPRNRMRAAESMGTSRLQLFLWVAVPSCVHFALQGMRLAIAGAFLTIVAAEMIAARSGVGFLINDARSFMETDTMFAGIVMLAFLGFFSDKLFQVLSWIFLRRYRLAR